MAGTCNCSSSRSLSDCSGPTPTGVHGDARGGKPRQRRLVQRAAVLRAIGDQHDAGQRHAGGHLRHRFKCLADARCAGTARQFRQRLHRLRAIVEGEQPQLGTRADLLQRAVALQRLHGLFAPATASLPSGFAFMLPESSTSTATTFSRSRMRSTLSTGRHSSTSAAPGTRTAAGRAPPCCSDAQLPVAQHVTMRWPQAPAPASANSSHSGQPRANASSPLRNAQMECRAGTPTWPI